MEQQNKTLSWIRKARHQAYAEWSSDPIGHRNRRRKSLAKFKAFEEAQKQIPKEKAKPISSF